MRSIGVVLCIARRELGSMFLQPLAWVVMTALVGFNAFSFWWALTYPSIGGIPASELQNIIFTGLLFWLPMLVFLPVVAMRLIAEERQTGTLETLLTAPVREGEVVLGKYFAALGFYLVLLAPFLLFLALLAKFGAVDLWAAASGLVGLVLVGGFLLAASLAASATTRHQIVAAIVGFIVVLVLYIGPALLEGHLPTGEHWQQLQNHINLMRLMDDFGRGVMHSGRLFYPLSGIAYFLFAATRLVEAAKEAA